MEKTFQILLLAFSLSACTSIPTKVPELLEKTADRVDTQSVWVTSEWEASIASNSSASKLLNLIHPIVTNIDQSQLDSDGKSRVAKFLQGYSQVQQRLESSISQQDSPANARSNFDKLSKSVRFANTYIEKSVDENKRVEAVIEGLTTIRESIQQKGEKQ
ncbi:MAG: hypothetical protein FD135_4809 [Comamonadaceae bacterium]|nr:MAG: hypothetical protein FD135_4809 [Comamonadaceae bacterium]